jgi:hypothetical protein
MHKVLSKKYQILSQIILYITIANVSDYIYLDLNDVQDLCDLIESAQANAQILKSCKDRFLPYPYPITLPLHSRAVETASFNETSRR